jgi:hypothetical protein
VSYSAQYLQAAEAIQHTTYPHVRAFYAYTWAFHHLLAQDRTNDMQLSSQKGEAWFYMTNNLDLTLHDKAMPAQEAYDAASFALQVTDNRHRLYQGVYNVLQPFFENWPNEYKTWLLKGQANIHMAWDARGFGWSDSVTDEGWKLFNERLATAREALEHAWVLNQKDPAIAQARMVVARGEGGNQNTMELWFDRAMAVNTNDYAVCEEKLTYLEPKWYGTPEKMISFGKWCVKSTKWGGWVPLTLWDAHVRIYNYYTDDSEKAGYWQRPDVWADVQASFDRFIVLNPTYDYIYQDYALYAYKAQKWEKLNELIPKLYRLKNINYPYFGGQAEYGKMIQLAIAHSGDKKSK